MNEHMTPKHIVAEMDSERSPITLPRHFNPANFLTLKLEVTEGPLYPTTIGDTAPSICAKLRHGKANPYGDAKIKK